MKGLTLGLKGGLSTSEKEGVERVKCLDGAENRERFPHSLYFLCEAEWGMVAEVWEDSGGR